MATLGQLRTVVTQAGVTTTLVNTNDWTLVSLRLETAGPCVVGYVPNLDPISQGTGVGLSNQTRYFLLPPQQTMYIFSDATDRVSMQIQPLPIPNLSGFTVAGNKVR